MSLTIQPAGIEQLATVQQLAQQIWPHTFSAILSPEQIAYMLRMMYDLPVLQNQVAEKGHNFLLIYSNDTAIGFAGYELRYKDDKAKLHKIYLLREMQGKGAGKLLMDAVVAICRQHKQQSLLLNVNRYNSATEFYKRYGFKITAEEDIDIGNGFFMNDYVMEYPL